MRYILAYLLSPVSLIKRKDPVSKVGRKEGMNGSSSRQTNKQTNRQMIIIIIITVLIVSCDDKS